MGSGLAERQPPMSSDSVRVAALSIGNPHAFLRVDAITTVPVAEGPLSPPMRSRPLPHGWEH
jgi:hypothetical protein